MRAWLPPILALGLLIILAAPALADGGGQEEASAPPECHVDLIDRPPYVVIYGCKLLGIYIPPPPPIP